MPSMFHKNALQKTEGNLMTTKYDESYFILICIVCTFNLNNKLLQTIILREFVAESAFATKIQVKSSQSYLYHPSLQTSLKGLQGFTSQMTCPDLDMTERVEMVPHKRP